MENYLNEITPDMTRIVNDLLNRDFENATKDEIEVYAQWTRIHALHDSDIEEKREQRERRVQQRLEESKKQSEAAISALNALAELANAKLKAVENGKAQ